MQIETLQMGPSQALGGSETGPSHSIKSLLDLRRSIQYQGWKDLITLDEAWFDFSNQHEQIWHPDDEDPPKIERQMISSPKTVVTVVWNLHRFHLMNVLSKGKSRRVNIILIIFCQDQHSSRYKRSTKIGATR
jgi:hypothetical protein